MYLGTNHWLSVVTAAAESEAGEQDAGRTTESQGQNTGQVYSQDMCSVVPTLRAAGLWALLLRVDPLVEAPPPRGPPALGVAAASCL